jgi:hypothetical protein
VEGWRWLLWFAVPAGLGDAGLDLGQLPDLMAERLGIAAAQRGRAAAAGGRYAGDDLLAVLAGQQGTLPFGVTGLAATAPWRLGGAAKGLGVGVLGGGRQRGVAGVLGRLGFQFGDRGVQVGEGGVQLLDVGADVGRGSLKEGFRWQRPPVHGT